MAKDEELSLFKMMFNFKNFITFCIKFHVSDESIGLVGFEPTTKPL